MLIIWTIWTLLLALIMPCRGFLLHPCRRLALNAPKALLPSSRVHTTVRQQRFLSSEAKDDSLREREREREPKIRSFHISPMSFYRLQPSLPVRLQGDDPQRSLWQKKTMTNERGSDDGDKSDAALTAAEEEGVSRVLTGLPLHTAYGEFEELVRSVEGPVTIYPLVTSSFLPAHLELLHDVHNDRFALQTRERVSVEQLEEVMTEFLKTLPAKTKEQFIEMAEDEYDLDM